MRCISFLTIAIVSVVVMQPASAAETVAKTGAIDWALRSVIPSEHGLEESYGAPPLSLSEAIDTAMERSPYLRVATIDVDVAATRIREARGHMFPKITVSEMVTRTDHSAWKLFQEFGQERWDQAMFQRFADPDQINEPTPSTDFNTKVQIEQALYSGGRLTAAGEQARLGKEAQAAALERVRQEVVFDVVRTYYGVILAQRGLRVAKQAVKTLEAHVKTAQDLYGAGVVVRSDVLSANVQLAKTRETQIIAENQVKLAKAALSHYMGVDQGREFSIQADLAYVPLFHGLADLIKSALKDRPDLQQVIFGTEATRKGIDYAKAGYHPTAGLMASYDFNDRGLGDLFSDGDSYFLAAMANWTLFDGFITAAQVERATLETRKMEAQQERLRNGIELQVRQAFLSLQQARERIGVTTEAVDQAEESQRIIHNRYKGGVTTIVEVLDADTALLAARLSALQARYDHNLAQVELDFALGRLKS
jgi:outer membrane protein TolC